VTEQSREIECIAVGQSDGKKQDEKQKDVIRAINKKDHHELMTGAECSNRSCGKSAGKKNYKKLCRSSDMYDLLSRIS
jgi:hypothetical protein